MNKKEGRKMDERVETGGFENCLRPNYSRRTTKTYCCKNPSGSDSE